MANLEHLERLKCGVDVWNEWREQCPDVLPDLSGAELENVALPDANLSRADLSKAYLRGADLFGANLQGADLSETDLFGVSFFAASLRGVDLTGAKNLTRGQVASAVTDATTLLPRILEQPRV